MAIVLPNKISINDLKQKNFDRHGVRCKIYSQETLEYVINILENSYYEPYCVGDKVIIAWDMIKEKFVFFDTPTLMEHRKNVIKQKLKYDTTLTKNNKQALRKELLCLIRDGRKNA